MNSLANRVLNHLTVPNHPDRVIALRDLVALNAFAGTEVSTKNIVEEYLAKHSRGFCQAGIDRFRQAVGLQAKRKFATLMVTVELDATKLSSPVDTTTVGMKVLKALRSSDAKALGIVEANYNMVPIFEGGKYMWIEDDLLTTYTRIRETPPMKVTEPNPWGKQKIVSSRHGY